jgi:hypothetical protein
MFLLFHSFQFIHNFFVKFILLSFKCFYFPFFNILLCILFKVPIINTKKHKIKQKIKELNCGKCIKGAVYVPIHFFINYNILTTRCGHKNVQCYSFVVYSIFYYQLFFNLPLGNVCLFVCLSVCRQIFETLFRKMCKS